MILSNYTSNKYYVPISKLDSVMPIFLHCNYEIVDCEAVNTGVINTELVMFTYMDTLMPNETKKYKLNLFFDSSISMRYGSQLIYVSQIYEEKSFSEMPYNGETSEKILIISYRDKEGQLVVSPFSDKTVINDQMDKISFNVCDK